MRYSRIAALRALSGLPNRAPYAGYLSRSPGKRGTAAGGDERLQRFQHPYFAIDMTSAAKRPVDMFEAEVLI